MPFGFHAKGTLEDKIRLLCICALCRDTESTQWRGLVTRSGEADRSQVRDVCGDAAVVGAAESAGNAQSVPLHFVLQDDQIDVGAKPSGQFPSLFWLHSSLDDNSIRSSIFKATSGFLNFAKAGVKGILGDEDRSVVVQIVDELVNGKYLLVKTSYRIDPPL